jgi:hypothetical protein
MRLDRTLVRRHRWQQRLRAIERIPSHEAYQWMVDFVDDMVAPVDERAAETSSMAINGKGAFRRFKDALHRVDEQWPQA